MAENNRLSPAELGELVNISKRKVLDNMNSLKDKGIIVRIGSNKSGYWKVIEKEE